MKRISKRKLRNVVKNEAISIEQRQYVSNYLKNETRIKFFQWAILFFMVGGWEILAREKVINSFIFSSPSQVIKTILSMVKDGSLFFHTGITLLETFLSFILVILLSILIAVILWWNENVAKILEPYLVVLNSLPKSALAPVFIVWLGNNMKTIIVAAVSVSLFGAILTLYTAFSGIEGDKIKLIKTLGGSKADILAKVVIPSCISEIINVMKVNMGLSLVGVIIGEFLAAKAGLGYLIIYGTQIFRLDLVITSIVILAVTATILYKLLEVVEKSYQA